VAASLVRLAACFAVIACERRPSAETPSARVSAATPARDSTAPIARDSSDRCRWEGTAPRAHTGEEYGLAQWDSAAMAHGVALRCALRAGGPDVRVVVRGDYGGIPKQVDVYSPVDARRRMQTLALDNEQPAEEDGTLLKGEDLNDDGWTDLRVRTWSGTGGVTEDVFTWNPQRSRFEQDSVFPRGTGIFAYEDRPCVGEESESGGLGGGGETCWADGRWHLVRTYRLDPAGDSYVRNTHWLEEGRVVRTWTDTLPRDSADHDPEFRTAAPVVPRRARPRG